MKTKKSYILLGGGLGFLLIGFSLLMGMVTGLIAEGFILSFLVYGVCSIGLAMGLIGFVRQK
jgi:hypothetical protein